MTTPAYAIKDPDGKVVCVVMTVEERDRMVTDNNFKLKVEKYIIDHPTEIATLTKNNSQMTFLVRMSVGDGPINDETLTNPFTWEQVNV